MQERRKPLQGNRWGFSKQINIAEIAVMLGIFVAVVRYGAEVVDYAKEVNAKVAVLWSQFEIDQPEKAQQFRTTFPK